jgi:hypothetical protein
MVRYQTYAGAVGLPVILRSKGFSGMHPVMQQRVRELLEAAGGRVGWSEGVRSAQVQYQMFMDRYEEDPAGPTKYDGKRWRRVKGAPAAPPGRSMHEIGLAADLNGDTAWVVQHAASFGLQVLTQLKEPWHVQPAELPVARSQYEAAGSAWGKPGAFVEPGSAPAAAPAARAASAPEALAAAVAPAASVAGIGGRRFPRSPRRWWPGREPRAPPSACCSLH